MMQAQSGMRTTGFYEVRSGKCPECDTLFDDEIQKPQGDERYCPQCKIHRFGRLKQSGKVIKR